LNNQGVINKVDKLAKLKWCMFLKLWYIEIHH